MRVLFVVQGEGRGHLTQAISMEKLLRGNGHEVVEVLVGKSESRRLPGFFIRSIQAPIKHIISPNFLPTRANRRANLSRSVLYNVWKSPEYIESMCYILWNGRQTFITGFVTTVELAVIGTVVAFFLALLLVFCRIQTVDRPDNDFIRFWKKAGAGFAKVYSTVVRGTPMMVQAMIIYYGILGIIRATGDFSGAELNQIWSPFNAGLVTVSLNSTAYMMEVLRGGIAAVDKGQMEAARSLGLSQWQAMLKVVFPQGIKNSIPGLSNELVINIKDSSVLSIISVFDLTFAARTIGGNYYEYFPAFLIAAAIYLVLTMVATWLLGRFARRFNVKTEAVGSTSDTPVKVEE